MSVSGGTGARSRGNKDKNTQNTTKTETHANKIKVQQQATPEQIRLAQMIDNSDDAEVVKNIQQLVELTGKSQDEVAVALHDALNDPDRAYQLITEGETDQGEWQSGGRKRKQKPQPPAPTNEPVMNHSGDIHGGRNRTDRDRPDRSDRYDRSDRSDNQHDKENDRPDFRRQRRDTRPPRLSRGRGRERGGPGEYNNPREEDWEDSMNNSEGRYRGRGRGRGSRGSGGGGGRGASRGSAPRTFRNSGGFEPKPTEQEGPQIDLWTNETAETANNQMPIEDWGDDIWTGGLEESKVFEGNTTPPPIGTMGETLMEANNSNVQQPGHRIDLRELLPDTGTLHDPYSQMDTNGYLDQNYMVTNDTAYMGGQQDGGLDQQYMNLKEATESIKNSIGIGSAVRGGMPGSPPGLSQSAQQRNKPQRSRMPAPSKIPASAVEMPGHNLSSVDVQFGSDSFVFNNPPDAQAYQSRGSNIDQVAAIKSNDSAITSAILSSGQQPKMNTTPVRDGSGQMSLYNSGYQSSVTPDQSTLPQIASPPEPIPFPSMPTERSPSSQRTGLLTTPYKPPGFNGPSITQSPQSSLTASQYEYSTPASQYTTQPSQFSSSLSQYTTSQNQYPVSTTQYSGVSNQYSNTSGQYSANSTGVGGQYGSNTTGVTGQYGSNSTGVTGQYGSNSTSAGQYGCICAVTGQYGANSTGVTGQYGSNSTGVGGQYNGNNSTGLTGQYSANSNAITGQYNTNNYQQSFQSSQPGTYSNPTSVAGSTFSSQSSAFRDTPNSTVFKQTAVTQSYDASIPPSMYQSRDQTTTSAFTQRDTTTSGFNSRDANASTYATRDQQSRNYQRDPQSVGYNSTSTGYLRSDPLGNQSAYGRDSYTRESYSRDSQTSGGSGSLGSYPREQQQTASYPRDTTSGSFNRDATGSYQRDSVPANSSGSYGNQSYNRDTNSTSAYSNDISANASSYARDTSYPHDTATQSSSFTRDAAIYTQSQTDSMNSYSLDTQASGAYPSRDSQTSSVYGSSSPYGSSSQSAFTPQTTTPGYGMPTTPNSTSAFSAQGQAANKIGYGSQIQNSTLSYGTQQADITLPTTTAKSAFGSTPSYGDQTQNMATYGAQTQTAPGSYGSQLQNSAYSATYGTTQSQNTSYGNSLSQSSTFGNTPSQNSTFGTVPSQNSTFGAAQNSQSQNPSYGAAQIQNSTFGTSQTQNSTFGASQSLNSTFGSTPSQNYGTQSSNTAFNAQNYTNTTQYNPTAYNTQSYSSTKLSDNFSKLGVKDTTGSGDMGTPLVSAVTTSTYSTPSTIATVTTVPTLPLSSVMTNVKTSLPTTTKAATSNLLHGMPMLNTQYIMGQAGVTGIPPYFPMYPTSFDELQLLQQQSRMPLGGYYDMNFASPTSLTSRDQNALANAGYTGEGKVNRVDAQSPVPASQTQPTQSHQQTYLNPTIPPGYGFYPYSHLMPGTNFQYAQTMYMPPVTNAAPHVNSSAANIQYQKAYTPHSYGTNKSYDEMNHTPDFVKSAYQSQASKVSSSSGVADMTGQSPYGKTHATQGFEKAFTQNPFTLPGMPTGSQMGALTNPYAGYMMAAPHSQMLHHSLAQDSSGSSRVGQQTGGVGKTGVNKGYTPYWNN